MKWSWVKDDAPSLVPNVCKHNKYCTLRKRERETDRERQRQSKDGEMLTTGEPG